MSFEVIPLEVVYGPHLRWRDWQAEEGGIEPAGGNLHIFADPDARVRRADLPHGGGGDRKLDLTFSTDRFDGRSMVTIHFNAPRRIQELGGFAVTFTPGSVRAFLQDVLVAETAGVDLQPDKTHSLSLTTLGNDYELRLDGAALAAGTMPPPYTDNEGWTRILAENAHVILHAFRETLVAHPQPAPAWTRAEHLYSESFTQQSLQQNWIVNTGNPGSGMELTEGSVVFRHMSNAFLRRRFQGPLAMDCVVTPVPTGEFTAAVTDAIFIWMIDKPDGGFVEFLTQRSQAGDAGLGGLMHLPFYWVDLGGTNNVTTRMRRNPHRHMIRQFTDPPRLLERNRTYRITCVQIDHHVEFYVDGKPWIQAHDAQPLASGHVGFRAYCADLRLEKLDVWSLQKTQ